MDYVMDTVKGLSVDELIVITGHLKETVERYIVEHYPIKARFVEQKTLDGTAGAIQRLLSDESRSYGGVLNDVALDRFFQMTGNHQQLVVVEHFLLATLLVTSRKRRTA